MSGCHIHVPAMSEMEMNKDIKIFTCLACREIIDKCKCIWAAIRELQRTIPEHCDLNYIANDNLSKRLSYIEKEIVNMKDRDNSFSLMIAALENRVDILEESYRGLFHEYDHLKEKIVELGRKKVISNKIPHKCPVCDGKILKEIKIKRTESGNDKLVLECHACNGNGIVWG